MLKTITGRLTEGKFRIYSSAEYVFISHIETDRYILFDLFNENAVSEVGKDALPKSSFNEHKIHPHAIIGVVKIDKWSILLLVSVYEVVGSIDNKEIYTVREVDFVPLSNETFSPSIEAKHFLDGIVALFNTGFYYSFDYNLTISFQSRKNAKADDQYLKESLYYNFCYDAQKPLLDAKVNSHFIANFINGYVGIGNPADIGGEDAYIYLISRRSRFMEGTLFNCGGMDDHGNCANTVETEQIMKLGNKTFSFVQYRGSTPLFLKYNKLNLENQLELIEKDPETMSKALKQHIDRLTKKEKMNIYFINLLSDSVPVENMLNKHLQSNYFPEKTSDGELCKVVKYDLNNLFESRDFSSLENFVSGFVKSQSSYIQYFCEDLKFKSSINQKGVIRVNCLNGLDRTNVMQASLAWKILETQLTTIGFDTYLLFGSTFFQEKANQTKSIHPLMALFKTLWGVNGDILSLQYAGHLSDMKENMIERSDAVERFNQVCKIFSENRFQENYKNHCLKLLLHKDSRVSSAYIMQEEELNSHRIRFSNSEELIISVHSWNVNGSKYIKEDLNLREWLYNDKEIKTPDLYFVGLEEIVDLNATNIMFNSNAKNVELWKNLLTRNLNEIDKYVFVKELDLVGIAVFVFIKEKLKDNLHNIDGAIVKTGMMGAVGNKGSCFIRFNYLDTNLALGCAHLSAGQKNHKQRITELIDMINKPLNNPKLNKEFKLKDHDLNFIFGDLNFRVDLEFQSAKSILINGGSLNLLLEFDQFSREKLTNIHLSDLEEGPLLFQPTYKFDINTNEWDTSKKQRTPSWCDRIFFNRTEILKLLRYNKVQSFCQSDHKPIFGVFKALVSKVLPDKQEEILKRLKSGDIDHQFKEAYDQNILLAFLNLKRKTNTAVAAEPTEEDPWEVDDDEKGWGLANEIANNDKQRISQIFDLYNVNK